MTIIKTMNARVETQPNLLLFTEWKNKISLGNFFISEKFKNSIEQAKFVVDKLREAQLPEFNINIIANIIVLQGKDFLIKFETIEDKKQIIYWGYIEAETFEKLTEIYEKIMPFKNKIQKKPVLDGTMYWGDFAGNVKTYSLLKDIEYGIDDVKDFYPYLNLDKIREYITSTSSILILQGAPGTGKTRLIEALLHEFWQIKGKAPTIAYSANAAAHKNPLMWHSAMEKNFLILDDADDLLHGRETDERFSINVLDILRLSDSLFRLPIKIIFTTNSPDMKIDPAFARPGRTFGIYKTQDLKKEEIGPAIKAAKKIYSQLTLKKKLEESLKPTMSLAEIFSLFDGSQPQTKSALGFRSDSNGKVDPEWVKEIKESLEEEVEEGEKT